MSITFLFGSGADSIPSNTDIIDIPINKATSISAFKSYLDQCTTK